MVGRPKVFLSHTTRDLRDHALAHALARGLRARGADVWIAPDSIPAGDAWQKSLVSGVMKECTAFLVIVSAATRDAKWVINEIQLAKARAQKDRTFKILPLSVGKVIKHPLAKFLSSLQRVPYRDAFHEQLEAVTSAIGLRPQSQILLPPSAVPSQQFVGREYVFSAIKKFMNNNPNGYYVIEADPGAGKSALLAEFARREDAIAHYNIRSLAINTAPDFLTSICTQLIDRFALPYPTLPDYATKSGAFLLKALGEAAAHLAVGQKLVVAVDALDEVDTSAHPEGANILFLPGALPDGVFFVMTRRRIALSFTTSAPHDLCRLAEFSQGTNRDIATYIQRALKDAALQKLLHNQHLAIGKFVTKMTRKSEGNFMYLRHVLPALARGDYAGLAIDKVPQGLGHYYQDHWQRMGMTAKPLPLAKIRIVYILSEVRRPASRALISQFASTRDMKVDELAVQEILDDWREFLHETKNDIIHYSIYHASFREFLHRKDIVQAAGVTLPQIRTLIADDLWKRLFDDAPHKKN
jgi:hypothetical protein